MHLFRDRVLCFDAEEMKLLEDVSAFGAEGTLLFPLTQTVGESDWSFYERLLDYARSVR